MLSVPDLVSATIEARGSAYVDGVTENHALLNYMKRGNRRKPFSGGTEIWEELAYAENANVDSFSENDELPIAQNSQFTASRYAIKSYVGNIVFSGRERALNAGDARTIDLMEARIQNNRRTLTNRLGRDAYGDGTGNHGRNIDGLKLFVPDTPSVGMVGGIDRATYEWWRPIVKTGVARADLENEVFKIYAALQRGMEKSNLLVADTAAYTALREIMVEQRRFATIRDKGTFGFTSLAWENGVPILLDGGLGDPATDEGRGNTTAVKTVFILNTRYFAYRPLQGHEFRRGAAQTLPNRDATVIPVIWRGNLCSSNLKMQGKVKLA